MLSLYSSNWEMTIQTMDLVSRYYDLYIIHTCLLPQVGNSKSNNQLRKISDSILGHRKILYRGVTDQTATFGSGFRPIKVRHSEP